jgi:DNA-binding transcriptional MerR regulator/methylmalonyl-CoA mutase cobalamin-binding subunit
MSERLLRHSIKTVSERTGLSPHLIRAWERRYETIQPERTDGNQRLYCEEDIERLMLLKMATEAGHPIRTVAKLPVDELRGLVSDLNTGDRSMMGTPGTAPSPTAPKSSRTGPELVESALHAITAMDAATLESVLEEAVLSLGQVAVLSHVIGPLVQRVGDGWQAGTLKVGHEHLASAVIRTFLANAARPFAVHASAPMLVATTPSGQVHEIGAALVAAAAANKGWRITYLGPSLPAEEIASAALQSHARAVALSLVHPADDPQLPEELRRLQRLLPESTTLIVGGAAVDAYEKTLQLIGAKVCRSLNEFSAILDSLRQGSN